MNKQDLVIVSYLRLLVQLDYLHVVLQLQSSLIHKVALVLRMHLVEQAVLQLLVLHGLVWLSIFPYTGCNKKQWHQNYYYGYGK